MIGKVGIVGAGTMGRDIAQVCAMAHMDVALVDISGDALQRSMRTLEAQFERQVTRKGRDADVAPWHQRVRASSDFDSLASADLVVETASESAPAKAQILRKIDAVVRPSAIVATNTSSMSVSQLGALVRRPEDFIGLHFFNPATSMRLVEIVRGRQTSDATLSRVTRFAEQLGKQPVFVKDSPGFVVNRLLCPMINEAILLVQEGVATAQDVDAAMRLGCLHPVGPLALADRIGLDVLLAIMDVFRDAFNDPKYHAATLLRDLVAHGKLGRKSGAGFYEYAGAQH